MSDELKPLPCPCCDEEFIKQKSYNNKSTWHHPSNRCALIYISLDNQYRVELWNNRPREAALEAKNKKLREAIQTAQDLNTIELNMSNYNEEDVSQLNQDSINIYLTLEAALKETETSE